METDISEITQKSILCTKIIKRISDAIYNHNNHIDYNGMVSAVQDIIVTYHNLYLLIYNNIDIGTFLYEIKIPNIINIYHMLFGFDSEYLKLLDFISYTDYNPETILEVQTIHNRNQAKTYLTLLIGG